MGIYFKKNIKHSQLYSYETGRIQATTINIKLKNTSVNISSLCPPRHTIFENEYKFLAAVGFDAKTQLLRFQNEQPSRYGTVSQQIN